MRIPVLSNLCIIANLENLAGSLPLGDESIIAPQHVLHSLILKGMNQTFDALPSPYLPSGDIQAATA